MDNSTQTTAIASPSAQSRTKALAQAKRQRNRQAPWRNSRELIIRFRERRAKNKGK